jgi:hypothetical protein
MRNKIGQEFSSTRFSIGKALLLSCRAISHKISKKRGDQWADLDRGDMASPAPSVKNIGGSIWPG